VKIIELTVKYHLLFCNIFISIRDLSKPQRRLQGQVFFFLSFYECYMVTSIISPSPIEGGTG
jgi:hypothetical protein